MTDLSLSRQLLECSRRAAKLDINETFSLSQLFRNDWLAFLDGRNPNSFGQKFSAAVERGDIPHVRFHSVDRSPHQTRYIRISVVEG